MDAGDCPGGRGFLNVDLKIIPSDCLESVRTHKVPYRVFYKMLFLVASSSIPFSAPSEVNLARFALSGAIGDGGVNRRLIHVHQLDWLIIRSNINPSVFCVS